MSKHEEFLKERKYYQNVSQRTIEWHQQSLRWLGVEEPTEKQLKDCVITSVGWGPIYREPRIEISDPLRNSR